VVPEAPVEPVTHVEAEEPVEQTPYIIPIEDFKGGPLKDYKGGDELIRQLVAMAKGTKAQVVIVNVNVFNFNNAETLRIAAEAFKSTDLELAMKCLESPNQINQIAASLLEQMHSDPKQPQMHTIKMRKDLSRKQVDIYSRPTEDGPGEWLPFGYNAALTKLSEHAAALVYDAICCGVTILTYKFREHKRHLFLCAALPQLNDKTFILYDLYDDPDMQLSAKPNPKSISLKLVRYDGKLYDVPKNDPAIKKEIALLDKRIKSKGVEVIELLKEIQLTEKDLGVFLERTRRPLV
jgi:hypothetical protein